MKEFPFHLLLPLFAFVALNGCNVEPAPEFDVASIVNLKLNEAEATLGTAKKKAVNKGNGSREAVWINANKVELTVTYDPKTQLPNVIVFGLASGKSAEFDDVVQQANLQRENPAYKLSGLSPEMNGSKPSGTFEGRVSGIEVVPIR